MESQNYQVRRDYLSFDERQIILDWIENIHQNDDVSNDHLKSISRELKGTSYIFDISKTELTKYITNYQATNRPLMVDLPDFIVNLQRRISRDLQISTDNSFFQVVDMQKSGSISPHYDASIKGYVNFKSNVSILSDDYDFWIDKEKLRLSQGDLYSFEASLYKHWTERFTNRRVFLSFGFILPYHEINRTEEDPRVRLSERIQRIFQYLK